MGGAASVPGANKENGDKCFREGNFIEALYWYTLAIKAAESNSSDDKDSLAILYSNRSAAYLSNKCPDRSYCDAIACLELRPSWYKGYYRAAVASEARGKFLEAKEFVEKAILCNTNAQDEILSKLSAKLSEHIVAAESGRGSVDGASSMSSIYSWGEGRDGQLGLKVQGKLCSFSDPQTIPTLAMKPVVDVACGMLHTVAIVSTGEAYSWGSNTYGQCGQHDSVTRTHSSPLRVYETPTIIRKLLGTCVVGLACGSGHTVCVDSQGRAWAWGIGRSGQLGLGIEAADTPFVAEPQMLKLSSGVRCQGVACGISHSIISATEPAEAGRSNDTVACLYVFGSNEFGQLGLGDTSAVGGVGSNMASPRRLDASSVFPQPPKNSRTGVVSSAPRPTVAQVACGGGHTCLLDSGGAIYSCGLNNCGQLGLSDTLNRYEFTRLQVTSRDADGKRHPVFFAFIGCGEEYSAAISKGEEAERVVYTWGINVAGQLGNNGADEGASVSAAAVADVANESKEEVGTLGNFKDTYRRSLYSSTFGNSNFKDSYSPVAVTRMNGKGAESLVCSQGQVMAICGNGDVFTWGLPADLSATVIAAGQDEAEYREMVAANCIRVPERMHLSPTSANPIKVRYLSAGRKHFVLLAALPYAPNCVLVEDSITDEPATERLSFTIASFDVNNVPCESGGCVFQCSVNPVELFSADDGIVGAQAQPKALGDGDKYITIADNRNGTYSGAIEKRMLTCQSDLYDVHITCCGLHIMGSPFQVSLRVPLHPEDKMAESHSGARAPPAGPLPLSSEHDILASKNAHEVLLTLLGEHLNTATMVWRQGEGNDSVLESEMPNCGSGLEAVGSGNGRRLEGRGLVLGGLVAGGSMNFIVKMGALPALLDKLVLQLTEVMVDASMGGAVDPQSELHVLFLLLKHYPGYPGADKVQRMRRILLDLMHSMYRLHLETFLRSAGGTDPPQAVFSDTFKLSSRTLSMSTSGESEVEFSFTGAFPPSLFERSGQYTFELSVLASTSSGSKAESKMSDGNEGARKVAEGLYRMVVVAGPINSARSEAHICAPISDLGVARGPNIDLPSVGEGDCDCTDLEQVQSLRHRAGEDCVVECVLRDRFGNNVTDKALILAQLSAKLQPLEHSLSTSAIIDSSHKHQGGFDPLCVQRGRVYTSTSESGTTKVICAFCSFVAGRTAVCVKLNPEPDAGTGISAGSRFEEVLFRSIVVTIAPNVMHYLFTEVCNSRDCFQLPWKQVADSGSSSSSDDICRRDVVVQARDQFGNKITSSGDASGLVIAVYATAAGQKVPLFEPEVEDLGGGKYSCDAYYPSQFDLNRAFQDSGACGGEVPRGVRLMLSVCVVSLTREEVLYCPWELDREEDGVCCSSDSKKLPDPVPTSQATADGVVARLVESIADEQAKLAEEVEQTRSQAREELSRRSSAVAAYTPADSVTDIASSNKRLFMVESLNKLELTRRRAEDALRKERTKREQERQEARRKKQVRRVGGGFNIAYSKDI